MEKGRKGLVLMLVMAMAMQTCQQRVDPACAAVKCPENFRCQDGMCLRQQKQPKTSICFPIPPPKNLRAVRCTSRNYTCDTATRLPACGFTRNGLRKDFQNDCSPCLDASMDFFYRLPCSQSPLVCGVSQQCLNGACVAMFNAQSDSNLKICNRNSDCRPIIQICVANKCVTKTALFSALQKDKPASK